MAGRGRNEDARHERVSAVGRGVRGSGAAGGVARGRRKERRAAELHRAGALLDTGHSDGM